MRTNLTEVAKLYAEISGQPFLKSAQIDWNCVEEECRDRMRTAFGDGLAVSLREYRAAIFAKNPDLPAELQEIPLIEIKTYQEQTAVKSFGEHAEVIFVDFGLLEYVWRLNKVYLFGDQHERYSQRQLTALTVLRQAVNTHPPASLWNARPFLYQLGTIELVLRGVFDGTRQEAYGRADCEPAAAG